MKVLVTGAGGFLGSAVVQAARSAGHQVFALIRPVSAEAASLANDKVTIVAGDLRQRGAWCEILASVDAVIHCAAAASGDLPTQLAGTVLATENLLAALPAALQRFVHVSSFSVYDFSAPRWAGRLDELCQLEPAPLQRDAYTQTKLQQEHIVREHCRNEGIPLAVMRPGAIYGPGKDWQFGSAMRMGKFDLIFAPLSPVRLIHVSNCADAIVAGLNASIGEVATLNLVDDRPPTHWGFHRKARRAGAGTSIAVPIPYLVVRALGVLALFASKLFFHGRARLPEFLDLPRQQARWRPLRYDNHLARKVLAWQPRKTLDQGLSEMVSNSNGKRKVSPVLWRR